MRCVIGKLHDYIVRIQTSIRLATLQQCIIIILEQLIVILKLFYRKNIIGSEGAFDGFVWKYVLEVGSRDVVIIYVANH